MSDQAQRLRQLASNLKSEIKSKGRGLEQHRARVVAITSGKGGVGKTNFAVNLALALIQRGREVLLLDADLGLANVDVVLGTNPTYHLGHVVRGEKRLQDVAYRGPLGLKLIAGGSGLNELLDVGEIEMKRFISGLEVLSNQCDYLLLDTGAGLSHQVTSFVLAADEILVVTNPEPTAMTDAYATIKVIGRQNPSANVRLVMNAVEDDEEADLAINRLTMAALRFLGLHVDSLGAIPYDGSVTKAVKKQQPYLLAFPGAPAARAVKELAANLEGGNPEGGTGMFFDRLARFFSNLRA
ncbi:MAG: MinD/ParA family protein [Symbiobacteriia bacterium]